MHCEVRLVLLIAALFCVIDYELAACSRQAHLQGRGCSVGILQDSLEQQLDLEAALAAARADAAAAADQQQRAEAEAAELREQKQV